MKDRPIIFSTPMVQAILDGRKTMTRRIIKIDSMKESIINTQIDPIAAYPGNPKVIGLKGLYACTDNGTLIKCQYGKPGDTLWVKETFTTDLFGRTVYQATDGEVDGVGRKFEWTSSRFMPFAASRIHLEVISIRVERLQDISQDDARREGVFCSNSPIGPCYMDYHSKQCNAMTTARMSFRSLWESINSLESWDANPWVWRIEFKRIN